MENSTIRFNKIVNFLFSSPSITDENIITFIGEQGGDKIETEKALKHLLAKAQFVKIDNRYLLLANGSFKKRRYSHWL